MSSLTSEGYRKIIIERKMQRHAKVLRDATSSMSEVSNVSEMSEEYDEGKELKTDFIGEKKKVYTQKLEFGLPGFYLFARIQNTQNICFPVSVENSDITIGDLREIFSQAIFKDGERFPFKLYHISHGSSSDPLDIVYPDGRVCKFCKDDFSSLKDSGIENGDQFEIVF
jgi:hypothetical protein